MELFVFFAWLFVGAFALLSKRKYVSKFEYLCAWVVLMVRLAIDL